MRIIYYSPHPTHDIVSEVGYATHQREVINALRAAGADVMPVIMGGSSAETLNPLAHHTYSVPLYKKIIKRLVPKFIWTSLNNKKLLLHDKKAGQRLEKAILEFEPDLIYERSEYLQDSGAKLKEKYKIRYFLEVNAPLVEEMNAFEGYSLFHRKAHEIEKYKLKMADRVISVSSDLSAYLEKHYGCDADKIILQPNCINPHVLDRQDEALMESARNKFGLTGHRVIGFVGSMFPYHGVDVLIDAFKMVATDFSDVKLLIIGDGIVLNDLKKQAVELNIAERVVFTGKIPHSVVFNYIALMDICIMARSNWYGSPVKIFEYGLMNKPIIAPDTGPVKDVMENGKDALIISDNKNALAEAIHKLLADKEYAHTMAARFHEKVLHEYVWSNAADTILKACE